MLYIVIVLVNDKETYMPIKAIVFDLDDCLIHTFVPSCQNLRDVAIMWNREHEPKLVVPIMDVFAKHYKGTWYDWVTGVWPELSNCVEEFREYYIRNSPSRVYPAVPGADEALVFVFSNSYVSGILTGRDGESVVPRLKLAGLDDLCFDFICSTHDNGYAKPDPRAFEGVLEELGKRSIKPEESIYVGDQLNDSASEDVGIRFAAVCSGVVSKEMFLKTGVDEKDILPSIRELPRYLQTRYL